MPFELELFPFVVMSLEHKFIPRVAQQGEVAMVADLAGPGYKFELSSAVPAIGFPKATLKFPAGEVSLEEKEEEEVKKMLSINGILQHQILNGVFSAQFRDDDLKLRYLYKDEQVAFIPSISMPSNAYHLHLSVVLVLQTS
ncbi:Outer envelope pore protein 37, chloroplastic [Vitis vinifera]|uniref:Outer envelope pore protein 37, chloroplastic n=1 Tax=Vitis vinifera TaxID=29760 RepID=A0A438CAN2_VITVI|nr:Outer envelope pore protein 37, chloroplastic [Vitis vinifera]